MASYGQYCSVPIINNNSCSYPIVNNPCPIVNNPCPIVNNPCPIVNNPCPIVNNPCPIVNNPCPIVNNSYPVSQCGGLNPFVSPCSNVIVPTPQFSYAWTPSQVYNYRWCNRPSW